MPERNRPCPCGSGKKFKKCCGAPGRPIGTETAFVAGVSVVVPNERRILKVDPDALLNQLKREHPAFAKSFDDAFGEELRQISSAHARSMALIMVAFQELTGRASPAQQIMAALLLNGSNTLIAGIDVLRSGYRIQPGILLRNVVETLSTVAYMCVEPNAVAEYTSDRLRSERTLTRAKEVMPVFGRLYGFFSQEYAHLGSMYGAIHSLDRYEKGDTGARSALSLIRMVVVMFSIISELAFITFVSDPKYWKRVGKGAVFDPGESLAADIEFIRGSDPDIKLTDEAAADD